ncbi:MAG: aminotransferase class I/II-fold pyridoxal phosphate-dependent enzyme [Proteobacteria bacterium]|nr:aminotransferase class I/II-fold pyridoxal phosphate-dependent enzyme [Pseudomonadota bacterium]
MTDHQSYYRKDCISPSHNTANIRYAIREVTVLARRLEKAGKRILYLNIGDPNVYDFDLVDEAKAAASWALTHDKNGYAPSEGLPEALDAIVRDARDRQGIRNIVGAYTGNGASECIDLALTALVNPGDNVLLPTPTYPLYAAILTRLGVQARYYRLDESHAWQPDVAHMASLVDARTRAVVVINPNNPTGAIYPEACLRKIIDLAKANNLLILNDEIYERLILEGKHVSLASLDEEACVVTFNGLSKSYLGPGIRMGWGVLSGPQEKLADYYDTILRMLRARLCASHIFQWAIRPCLEGGQKHLPGVLDKLRRRRDLCMAKIAGIPGLSCVAPLGSFYAFVRVENVDDDTKWCKDLLEAKGVVVVPGSGFDYHEPGVGYFRIVFLPDEAVLSEAFDKIAEFEFQRSR